MRAFLLCAGFLSLAGAGEVNAQQYYEIQNLQSGLVLDVTGGSKLNGAPIQQYQWLGGGNQQWQIVPVGNGYNQIQNLQSGLVLDVTLGSLQNGALIQQWQWTGGGNQQWSLIPLSNGYYEIQNWQSGKVLDVVGGSMQNGARIQQYQWLGGGNQQWLLIPVSNAHEPALELTMGSMAINAALPDVNGISYGYAYGASVINVGGPWWMYFCSGAEGTDGEDAIRYSTSSDGKNWSTPTRILQVTANPAYAEGSTCDPSVVYYNGYYYMFYGGDPTNSYGVHYGGGIFVARAVNPWGPFLKYTSSGTWAQSPTNPQIVVTPTYVWTGYYGAGQPTVVVFNGALYMWYTDTTLNYPNGQSAHTLFRTSSDGVHWSSAAITNIPETGGEVKYDPLLGQFVFFNIEGGSPWWLSMRTSSDGVNWSSPQQVGDVPEYSGNVGISGSNSGWTMQNQVYAYFGAPYNLAQTYNPSQQDIYWAGITGTDFYVY